ncbi:TMEM175 family protein [Amycolatopsis sp. NPDC005961]|uniref:TMEM175 family protein n=1 Tax=Amycolatopsis sp. NPDC005961 TaxID=3156720 RepID=UPI0033CB2042
MSSATSDEDTVGSEARAIAAERLTFFSDAVVAIAITLLALELPLPEGATNAELLRSLGHHQSEYVLISFIVVAVHWRAHHRLFPFVTTVRGGLLQLTFGWLLTMALMPFTTKVIAEDGGFEFRFVLYALVQVVALALLLVMTRQIQRHHLHRADTPPELFGEFYRGLGAMIAAFAVSIPVAFFTHWAYACWVVIPFVGNPLFRLRRPAALA